MLAVYLKPLWAQCPTKDSFINESFLRVWEFDILISWSFARLVFGLWFSPMKNMSECCLNYTLVVNLLFLSVWTC